MKKNKTIMEKEGTLEELVDGEITTKIEIPRKVCRNHEIMYFLMGEKCPYCNRLSISAYEL